MKTKTPPFPLLAALLVIILSSLVLFGWEFDNEILKSTLPFWSPMKANAAVCFILLGCTIILSSYSHGNRTMFYIGQSTAILAGLISLLTLVEYAFHINFGIDELLFYDPIKDETVQINSMVRQLEVAFPGRIKLEAAVCILLLSLSSIHSNKNYWHILSASCGVIVFALAIASLSYFITPNLGQFGWFGYGVMRANAAVLFILLGIAKITLNWQRNISSWSLSLATTLAFIAGIVLLVLIGFHSSRTQFWLQSTYKEIAANENKNSELNDLLVSVSKAQTTTRGYVITGSKQFLNTFLSAKTDSFTKLNNLTSIEPVYLTAIDTQVKELFQWYQKVIESSNGGSSNINDMIFHGTELLDHLNQLLVQVKTQNEQRMAQLKQEAGASTLLSYRFISIGTLLSVLVFLAVIFRFNVIECQRKQMEFVLRNSKHQLQLVLEGGQLGFWDWNILTNEVQRNARWAEMLGYSHEEIEQTTSQWTDFVHPEDREKAWQSIYDVLKCKKNSHKLEYRMLHKDGSIRWILDNAKIVQRDKNGKPIRMTGTHLDITERKLADVELRIAATVFEAQESMLITDANNIILRVNNAFTKMTGYSEAEVLGKNPRLLQSGRHDKAFYMALWQSLNEIGTWQGEIWNKRKNGEIYPEWITITAVKADSTQKITHYVETATDITGRKAAEEEIKKLAFFDPLTGLPNRRQLFDHMSYLIKLNHREGKSFAVFMMDLDKFKAVNDTFGHAAGDDLLKQVASRITTRLRDSDLVARLGGDEFVILLEDCPTAEDAEKVATNVIADLTVPFELKDGNVVQIGASIGISFYPKHGDTPEKLTDNADQALYKAKDNGRGCFQQFSL